MGELVFEVVKEAVGGQCDECLTESTFTQADSSAELRWNFVEAANAFYFDKAAPASVCLHLVRDEVFAIASSSLVTVRSGTCAPSATSRHPDLRWQPSWSEQHPINR